MFSHIVLGANDTEASKKFYDAILSCLGYEAGKSVRVWPVRYTTMGKVFFLHLLNHWTGPLQIVGNGSTISFSADSSYCY